MSGIDNYYVLNGTRSSVVLDCRSNTPSVLYWGPRLSERTTPEMLALLATRQQTRANAATEPPIALSPELGAGFIGEAGIQAHRKGRQWSIFATLESVDAIDPQELSLTSRCAASGLEIEHRIRLDAGSDVLCATTEICNTSDENLRVDRCNAPSLPIPPHIDSITGFEGRWSNEFQRHTVPRFLGTYLRENRRGRTSHDTFPGVLLHAAMTTEDHGDAYGLHLGWSGNHRLRVDEHSDGRAFVQLGELFYPGELFLGSGASYRSPVLYATYSNAGFGGLSRSFHRYVRKELTDARVDPAKKPVHFNTWEAVYFDMSPTVLDELVAAAADSGVERFVLDDGWFRNRNDDRAGLGDWYVDEAKFPDGLGPLVDNVRRRGMQFGLWVEPEMVNPDSDLYRAHPDWVLATPPAPAVVSRHQYVLDLTRPEVVEYLFGRIDSLLTEYDIAYLKWDMNRDLDQPGDADGRAATHAQTLAVYALLDRLRRAHPRVEIESCASGGGRADFGILRYTDRIWTSDNNDPLDRLRIQRGFSMFFPAHVMGAHVGPRCCHITGRTTSMAFRAGVALFGDFGVEANLLEIDDAERAELKAAIALHKKHRKLLFSGELYRLESARDETAFGVVAEDKSEALFSYALTDTAKHSTPGRVRLSGLDPDRRYSVERVWPVEPRTYSPSILDVLHQQPISGAALMSPGIQLPVLDPQSVLIWHLRG